MLNSLSVWLIDLLACLVRVYTRPVVVRGSTLVRIFSSGRVMTSCFPGYLNDGDGP